MEGPVLCPQCGSHNPEGSRFCNGCGAPLLPEQVSSRTTAESASRPASLGDRRPVTVLFADIFGFTSLAERLDPDAVSDLVTACFERLVPCIERYGGTIDKFIGDEVMALFGAPVAHENDPERALRAALDMQDALAEFNREQHLSLGLHFGVNTGLVYAGEVGGGGRYDYSVIGDAVNVSSRLKGAADPGEILVGVDTYRQTEHLFDFEKAESVRLKGKSQPVAVYRLLRARAAAAVGERFSRSLSSPLVGREAELASFRGCLTRLRAGEGSILILTGGAGLGKSRLVSEVRSEAQEEGFSWLEGSAVSFGRTISYWPLREIIQQDAGISNDDSNAERWAKLARRLEGLSPEGAGEILPYLATLLSIPLPDELARKVRLLDGEATGRQIYRATRLYFASLAREHPTVVVFEDLHWLDGSSAALLEHLLSLTKETPIILCLVSRPDRRSALGHLREHCHNEYPERVTEIDLRPLSAADSAVLARNLICVDDLPARLQESVTVKAEGNPFYVEEVVRSLIDQGGLVLDPGSGRYRVTEEAVEVSIPDTLLGVITARVDRLDEDLKQILRRASVVGRNFFYRVLAAIVDGEHDLDSKLADLEERELILEKTRVPELEYVFKHALVQEATYESVPLARRKELHRDVASAIKTLFAQHLDDFHSLLAYHYSKAEDWEQAQEHLFKAGDQAGRIAADTEALAHYEEALDAYTRVFGDTWDPLERAVLERKMGEALYRRGEHERAREYLYRALGILGNPFPTTSRALRRAIALQGLIQLSHRLFFWLPRRTPSPEAVRLASETIWLKVSLAAMDPGALYTLFSYLVILNKAESTGITWWADVSYAPVGYACDFIPLRRIARYYFRLGARSLEQGGDRGSREEQEAYAINLLVTGSHEYLATGEWSKALDHLRSAGQELLALGNIRHWALDAMTLSLLLIDRGELEEPLGLCREVASFARESGDQVAEALGLMGEGYVLVVQGDFAGAEACFRQAAQQAVVTAGVAMANSGIAHCYLKQGRLEEARAILAEEAVRARDTGARGYVVRHWRIASTAAPLLAFEQATEQDKKRTAKEARTACRECLKHAQIDIPALVRAYRMRGTYEYLCDRPGRAKHWWHKSLEQAEQLGAWYEGALTHLEIGKRMGDRTALEAAEVVLAGMGAEHYLSEVRLLLGRP